MKTYNLSNNGVQKNMKLFNEFKEFISRGNVLDMAVGVVMGAAFKSIIDSFVQDLIMPCIGTLTGKVDISKLSAMIVEPGADGKGGLVIPYGNFVQQVLNFLIIAAAIFFFVKTINTFRERLEKRRKSQLYEDANLPETSEELLTEIRDMLKSQALSTQTETKGKIE